MSESKNKNIQSSIKKDVGNNRAATSEKIESDKKGANIIKENGYPIS